VAEVQGYMANNAVLDADIVGIAVSG
jgi:hypothetical protein